MRFERPPLLFEDKSTTSAATLNKSKALLAKKQMDRMKQQAEDAELPAPEDSANAENVQPPVAATWF